MQKFDSLDGVLKFGERTFNACLLGIQQTNFALALFSALDC